MLKDPQFPVPSTMVVQMPNKASLTRMGCVMERTFSGYTAMLGQVRRCPRRMRMGR